MSEQSHKPRLVSVITVVRNAESVIAETLKSICEAKTPDVELIVIDGKSTDRTLDIIANYAASIDILVSESDDGIYDAMNKGAARASGKFLLHINAGDLLLRIPTAELSTVNSAAAIASFPVALSSGGVFQPRDGFLLSITNTLHHQGNFYRKSLMRPYDLRYSTFADFDLNQRLESSVQIFSGAPPVAFHSEDGRSHDRKHFSEVYKIVSRNHGILFVLMTWVYFKVQGLRWRLKSVSRSFS